MTRCKQIFDSLIIIIPAIYLFMIYNVDPEMEMNWPIVIMTKHLSYDIALMDFLIVWRDVISTAIILTIIIPGIFVIYQNDDLGMVTNRPIVCRAHMT